MHMQWFNNFSFSSFFWRSTYESQRIMVGVGWDIGFASDMSAHGIDFDTNVEVLHFERITMVFAKI